MVLESAEIMIKPGMEAEFEAAVREAAPLFRRGCSGMRLQRASEDLQAWRRLVGHCFGGAPAAARLGTVHEGF